MEPNRHKRTEVTITIAKTELKNKHPKPSRVINLPFDFISTVYSICSTDSVVFFFHFFIVLFLLLRCINLLGPDFQVIKLPY